MMQIRAMPRLSVMAPQSATRRRMSRAAINVLESGVLPERDGSA